MSKEEALGGTRTKSLSVVGRVFANLCIYNLRDKDCLASRIEKKTVFCRVLQYSRVELKENVYHQTPDERKFSFLPRK